MANPIVIENAQTGTSAWRISNFVTTQLQLYADKLSYNPGETVSLSISTATAGTTYSLGIYRLGWYGGYGGLLKQSASGLVGVAQGMWDSGSNILSNCPTAYSEASGLLEPNWTVQYTWTIPGNACTGVYLVLATDASGNQFQATFVVKGSGSADYGYMRGDFTDAAYSQWGGKSLYTNEGTDVKVSLHRPSGQFSGSGGTLIHEAQAIHWLERQGYNLSYVSCMDVHTTPGLLSNYKAVLIGGHNEYWTREMRDAMDGALASGIGLGFLGANGCYWQARIENGHDGSTNTVLTCYKVGSPGNVAGAGPLANDPFFGIDNTRVTTTWRDVLLHRPESVLTGTLYQYGNHFGGFETSNVQWIVDSGASSSLLTGTGLVPGASYGIDGVGYEWDSYSAASAPSGLQVIGTTPCAGTSGTTNSTTSFYIHPSGARVFASGAVNFANMLDDYRWTVPTSGQNANGPRVSPPVQQFLANVLQQLPMGKNASGFVSFGTHA